ncbi:MAG: penicillin acylase family protein [Nitrospinota bacterium]|nr:MAG: penicillin acylase family protein [Nitrospinota bacterium]
MRFCCGKNLEKEEKTIAMERSLTREDLRASLPVTQGTLSLEGLEAEVNIYRDSLGIPHIHARTVHDAFFAQGFAHAQDRLWHMDSDRHRAYGRWAEFAGPAGVEEDLVMRRFRLAASVQADYAVLNEETRAMLEAYAAGVNAFIQTTPHLPIEYRLVESAPEPWQPWDSLAVFKVRHILMGVWQAKLWRAQLVRHLGPEMTAKLFPGYPQGDPLIIPPGIDYTGPLTDGQAELTTGAAFLAWLPEEEGGSNNWVVAGNKTASGRPLLAGDPHRTLDTPNVYYQNHLACPDFDVIGFSFPGVPGFPHFGHNRYVAWGVTHTGADYQDLYIERFDPANPQYYEFQGAWHPAERYPEVITVRGGAPVEIEVIVTRHGPVVLGQPESGYALAFRYTATAEPNPCLNALLPMMRASSADAFEEALRPWVDPVNNIVYADVQGNIGYRTRGQVPIRPSLNAWLPVPGWSGEYEWQGVIPFAEMPAIRNPDSGFVVTANNRVVDERYPYYIAFDFAPGFRARRITERLQTATGLRSEDMAAIHADRISLPGRAFVPLLTRLRLSDPLAVQAQEELSRWDGSMEPDSVAALIYTAFRECLIRNLMRPILGPLEREAFQGAPRGGVAHMARLRARLHTMIQQDDRTLLPAGETWETMMERAFTQAIADLRERLGEDMQAWQWGRLHKTAPQHPLSTSFPALSPLLDPPAVSMGGDGDTVQAAAFSNQEPYLISVTSVARYVFDLGDWNRSAWVVPLGSSGHPGSPHYADQVERWRRVELFPMLYDWTQIAAQAESHQRLQP